MRKTPEGTYLRPLTRFEFEIFREFSRRFATGNASISTFWLASFFMARIHGLEPRKRDAIGAFGPVSRAAAYMLGGGNSPRAGNQIFAEVARISDAALDAIEDLFVCIPRSDLVFMIDVLEAERFRRAGLLTRPWWVRSEGRTMAVCMAFKAPTVQA